MRTPLAPRRRCEPLRGRLTAALPRWMRSASADPAAARGLNPGNPPEESLQTSENVSARRPKAEIRPQSGPGTKKGNLNKCSRQRNNMVDRSREAWRAEVMVAAVQERARLENNSVLVASVVLTEGLTEAWVVVAARPNNMGLVRGGAPHRVLPSTATHTAGRVTWVAP